MTNLWKAEQIRLDAELAASSQYDADEKQEAALRDSIVEGNQTRLREERDAANDALDRKRERLNAQIAGERARINAAESALTNLQGYLWCQL